MRYPSSWARPLLSTGPFSPTEANPLQTGVDRAFAALADSLGLSAARTVLDDVRGLTEAEIARVPAVSKYLGVAGGAVGRAAWHTVLRLDGMRETGETVDSAAALLRVWRQALDRSMHAAMQSDDGVEATARLVRVDTESRLRLGNLLGHTAHALGLPTRRDLDEAYREIQLLKRELRK